MGDLLITDIAVLTPQGEVQPHRTVEIENGVFKKIRAFRGTAEHGWEAAQHLDGRGKLLMPPLADCHMHTGQQLLKGRVLDALPMIWTRIMLPFESTLDDRKMRLSASLAALEMIKSGTGAFVEAGSYHMDAACEVYAQSGLRGLLSVSTMDQPELPSSIAADAAEALARADRLYDTWNGRGRLRAAYALRSLLSCSRELTEAVSARARERGALLQAHMNEYPNEVNYFLQTEGMRPVEYLERLGVLGEHFISAHSLLLSEEEKEIFARRGVKVCHCPFSNCGKGVPDTNALLNRGICVGLGSDGAAHGGLSLWNEMKVFRSVMNVRYGVPLADPAVMPAKRILKLATENGFRLMGLDGGKIEEGAPADFITVSLREPHLYPTGCLTNTLVESAVASDVRDLAVEGSFLMRDREVLTLDEEKILWEAEQYEEGRAGL